MVTHISLVQETRGTDFITATGEAPILGQYIVEDYEESKAFGFSGDSSEQVSKAQVKFRMPFPLAQNVLPRKDRPQERVYFWQGARYAEIAIGYTKPRTWLIQGTLIEEIGASMATVTLNLQSPLAWVFDYPTLAGTDGKDLVGNRVLQLETLTKPLSDVAVDAENTGKRLPIKPYSGSWTPTTEQAAAGYVQGNAVNLAGSITIPNPFPLSIGDALPAVFAGWNDGFGTYGLTVIEESTAAGPYWRWVTWKHVLAPVSYTLQDLGLKSLETSNRFTDVLTYNEDNPQEHRYNGGPGTLANPFLNGAWLSVEFKGFKKQDPAGVLPPSPTPPNMDVDTGGVGGWGPGSGIGGGSGFTNPGTAPDVTQIEGNTLLPTPEGTISPGGNLFNDTIDPRDVSFLVNIGDSATSWTLPNTNASTGATAVSWDLYVDGRFVETRAITRDGNIATITLPSDGADHVVTLKPTGGNYTTGIFERIGYSGTSPAARTQLKQILALGKESYRTWNGTPRSLANQWTNCTELTRVAEPDSYFSHATIPSGFESARFAFCAKLEKGPEVAVDFSITATGIVPANFRYQTYRNCVGLKRLPNIMPLLNVTEIGAAFYYAWAQGCISVAFPQAFQVYQNVTKVGDFFYSHMFETGSTPVGDRTPPESLRNLLPNVEFIGNNFMDQWKGQISTVPHLATKIIFPLMPKLRTVGNSFLYYFGADSKNSEFGGVEIDPMPDWPLLEAAGNSFMAAFARRANVEQTMAESNLVSLKSFGTDFMSDAYGQNAPGGVSEGRVVSFLPEKFPAGYIGTSVPAGYRSTMYTRAKLPSASKQAWPILETATRSMTKGSNYRSGGFSLNGYNGGNPDPISGQTNRIRYQDGVEVITGQNGIPTTFYNG